MRVKDQKLLWARAAGRCSECHVLLTLDDGAGAPATVGQMCHIVGENEGSARYQSNLSTEERDSYSNRILMCAHHHTIVDADEVTYTIEKLHLLKTNYEIWVTETLGAQNVDPDEMVYLDLIDTITIELQLENWTWFIDNAVRNIVHIDFVDAQGVLNRKLLRSIWPSVKPELKASIIGVLGSFDQFMQHFLSNADHKNNYLRRDVSYKRLYPNPDYHKYKDKEDIWERVNYLLLSNYIINLNKFADAVRTFSNPLYFRTEGIFLIEDSMGYHSHGENTISDVTDAEKPILKMLNDIGYTPGDYLPK